MYIRIDGKDDLVFWNIKIDTPIMSNDEYKKIFTRGLTLNIVWMMFNP